MSTKIDFKSSLAYGVGGLAEGIGYNFFFAYFLFFLTNIAGMEPALAGIIALIAVLWDGVSDPVIGYLSDNSKNPKGRRRPILLIGSIFFGLAVYLLFANFNIPESLKPAYYIIVNIIYWTALTSSVIPHTSLGSELTDDFNARTKLRAFQTFFMNIGLLVATSSTLMFVSYFGDKFGSEKDGWASTGMIFGALVFMAYFISWYYTRGKEPENVNLLPTASKEKKNFFKSYISILKNKPLKNVLWLNFFVNFILGVAVSIRIYMYTYNFGFDEMKTSTLLLLYGIVTVLSVALVQRLSLMVGKKKATIIGMATYAIGFALLLLLPASQPIVIAGLILEGYGNCTFWTMLYALAYDTSVVEEYKTGDGSEGIIVSMVGFIMKAGNALGMMGSGLGLSYLGFNAELATQSASTLIGIKLVYTLVPIGGLVLGILLFMKYPLTESVFNEMKEAVRLKNIGKAHSSDVLKKVI